MGSVVFAIASCDGFRIFYLSVDILRKFCFEGFRVSCLVRAALFIFSAAWLCAPAAVVYVMLATAFIPLTTSGIHQDLHLYIRHVETNSVLLCVHEWNLRREKERALVGD